MMTLNTSVCVFMLSRLFKCIIMLYRVIMVKNVFVDNCFASFSISIYFGEFRIACLFVTVYRKTGHNAAPFENFFLHL